MGQISAVMQIMEEKISVKCGAAQHLIKKNNNNIKKKKKISAVKTCGIRIHIKK